MSFDLELYLKNSKKVDVSDLDFAEAARWPLTADEVRCLTYTEPPARAGSAGSGGLRLAFSRRGS